MRTFSQSVSTRLLSNLQVFKVPSLSQQHRHGRHRIQVHTDQYPQVPMFSLVPCSTLLNTVPTHSAPDETQRGCHKTRFHQQFECKTWKQRFSANLAASGREIRCVCESVFLDPLSHTAALCLCQHFTVDLILCDSQASVEERPLRLECGTSYQLMVQVQCGSGRTRR